MSENLVVSAEDLVSLTLQENQPVEQQDKIFLCGACGEEYTLQVSAVQRPSVRMFLEMKLLALCV